MLMEVSNFLRRLFFACFFLLVFLVCGCSVKDPVSESEGDPCSQDQLKITIKPLDNRMRAFEDATQIAYNLPRQGVGDQIAELQAYRRETVDLNVPECLNGLKHDQVDYMNSVIDNLLVFMKGAPGEVTNTGLEISSKLRVVYSDEYANLMGVTVTPRPTKVKWTPQLITPTKGASLADGTATPSITATDQKVTPTLFSTVATINNQDGANIRVGPGVNYEYLLNLPEGEKVDVFGRTEDQEWLLIMHPELPDEFGWVFITLVEVEIPIGQIPVVEVQTPTPVP